MALIMLEREPVFLSFFSVRPQAAPFFSRRGPSEVRKNPWQAMAEDNKKVPLTQ